MPRNKSSLEHPKIARLELYPLDDADDLLDWVEEDYGRAAQALHDEWLTRHVRQGTPAKHAAGKPTGGCVPQAWNRALADKAKAAAPSINGHAIDFLIQWWRRTLSTKRSSARHRKAWTAILCGDEAPPQFKRLPPRVNGAYAWIDEVDDKLVFRAKLAYVETGGGRRLTHSWEVRRVKPPLSRRASRSRRKAKRWANYELALQVARGERHLATSQIVRRDGRTFLMLSVEGAEPPVRVLKQRAALVTPGLTVPLKLFVDGQLAECWGEEFVDLLARRRSTLRGARPKGTRRHAAALAAYRNLSDTICHVLSRRAADAIAERRCGRITIDDGGEDAILVRAGMLGDDVAKFPLEKLRRNLTQKLARRGIAVSEERKTRSGKARIANRRKELATVQVREVAK